MWGKIANLQLMTKHSILHAIYIWAFYEYVLSPWGLSIIAAHIWLALTGMSAPVFDYLCVHVLTWKYMVSMETDQETMKAGAKIWLHPENKYVTFWIISGFLKSIRKNILQLNK